MHSASETIVIVGSGHVLPGAPRSFEELTGLGQDAVQELPEDRLLLLPAPGGRWQRAGLEVPRNLRGCVVEESAGPTSQTAQLARYLEAREFARLDRAARFAVAAALPAWQALAGVESRRTAVVLGNIALPTESTNEINRRTLLEPLWASLSGPDGAAGGSHPGNRITVPGRRVSSTELSELSAWPVTAPAAAVSAAFGLGAGYVAIDAACASSLYAVQRGMCLLRAGCAEAVLVGGVSGCDRLYTQLGFSALQALSRSGQVRPFDQRADGLLVGEGAAVFALTTAATARRLGLEVQARICGIGLSNDRAGGLLAPSAEGQLRCMRAAYAAAGFAPTEVDLVECHATGTPLGDAVEIESLTRLLDGDAPARRPLTLSAVKANVGHLLTGAGAAGLLNVLTALREERLPPIAHFEKARDQLHLAHGPFRILEGAEPWPADGQRPRRAAVSGFGFGGINAHLVIEEWRAPGGTSVSLGGGLEDRAAVDEEGQGGIAAELSERPVTCALPILGAAAQLGSVGEPAVRELLLDARGHADPAAPDEMLGERRSSPQEKGRGRRDCYQLTSLSVDPTEFRIPPRELSAAMAQQVLALQISKAALIDAGLLPATARRQEHWLQDGERCGVYVATELDPSATDFSLRWMLGDLLGEQRDLAAAVDDSAELERLRQWVDETCAALDADLTLGSLGGIVASRIAREFGVGGPAHVVSAGELSGWHALDFAREAIARGDIDRALVVGIDLAGDPRVQLARGHRAPRGASGEEFSSAGTDAAVALVVGEPTAASTAQEDGGNTDPERHLEPAQPYALLASTSLAGAASLHRWSESRRAEDLVAVAKLCAESAAVEANSCSWWEVMAGTSERSRGLASGVLGQLESKTEAKREHMRASAAATGTAGGAIAGGESQASRQEPRCTDPHRDPEATIGEVGTVRFLLGVYRSAVALAHGLRRQGCQEGARSERARIASPGLEPLTEPWPASVGILAASSLGGVGAAVLRETPQTSERSARRRTPLLGPSAGLFLLAGKDVDELRLRIEELLAAATGDGPAVPTRSIHVAATASGPEPGGPPAAADLFELSRRWWHAHQGDLSSATVKTGERLAVVAGTHRELVARLRRAAASLEAAASPRSAQAGPELPEHEPRRDKTGLHRGSGPRQGRLAFVYPGSGNLPAAGARGLAGRAPLVDLFVHFPQALQAERLAEPRFDEMLVAEVAWGEREGSVGEQILAQVSVSQLLARLGRWFGLHEDAAIGYSLGETAALFASGVWRQRHEMLARLHDSTLFTRDLAGECRSARRAWGVSGGGEFSWCVGVVALAASDLDALLADFGEDRAIARLIVNTENDCVIGGERATVEDFCARHRLVLQPLHGVSTVHCRAADSVADAYRSFHHLPTHETDVTIYSAAWARAYEPSPDSCAASLTEQAMRGFDFPSLIRVAWRDGVRTFVEIGPGASCSRMIRSILAEELEAGYSGEAEPLVCALAPLEVEPVQALLEALAALWAQGHRWQEERLFGQATTQPRTAAPLQIAPRRASLAQGLRKLANRPSVGQPEAERARHHEAREAAQHANPAVAESKSASSPRALEPEAAEDRAFPEPPALAAGEDLQGAVPEPSTGTSARGGLALDRAACLEFARGRAAEVFGHDFAAVDAFPTRVRLPDEPLMLVDRVLSIEGEAFGLSGGRIVTEHVVRENGWYLDEGVLPTAIAVESGQADLMLAGYLGIDLRTRGVQKYRLLDAVVTFHSGLPRAGDVVRYDIEIERFFRQGPNWLFRFRFDASVDGEPMLQMRDGCAGFFSEAELAAGGGVVRGRLATAKLAGTTKGWQPLVTWSEEHQLDEQGMRQLRRGEMAAAFGVEFSGIEGVLGGQPSLLPEGLLELVDRVPRMSPTGGRYGLGVVEAEADIDPEAWFLTCHFVDDQVMPGTLMYECCLHALRVLLLRMGWLAPRGSVRWEPVIGVASRLRCRGQVLASTSVAGYRVEIKEIGYRPEPYVIADATLLADGREIVEINDLSLQLSGSSQSSLEQVWEQLLGPQRVQQSDTQRMEVEASAPASPLRVEGERADEDGEVPCFDRRSIVAFSSGRPSEAFGREYEPFDQERRIARLPRDPYQFLDEILEVEGEPFALRAGASCTARWSVPANHWTYTANRQDSLPFAVLLEVALQPCGWLAAYCGSALTSEEDLSFRNLGGKATLLRHLPRRDDRLSTHVELTRTSSSGGMIIQHYSFETTSAAVGPVYSGTTYFGFFPQQALANQVGLQQLAHRQDWQQHGTPVASLPASAPFPTDRWRMIDAIDALTPSGGAHGRGFVRGTIAVDPAAWFFQAHFYQDPVWPGSLGLEAFVQLLRLWVVECAADQRAEEVAAGTPSPQDWMFSTEVPGTHHEWTYRGQITPLDQRVVVEASIRDYQPTHRGGTVKADGLLSVDGRVIYRIESLGFEFGRGASVETDHAAEQRKEGIE